MKKILTLLALLCVSTMGLAQTASGLTGYGKPLTLEQFKALAGTGKRFAFVATSVTASDIHPRCDHWMRFTNEHNGTLDGTALFYLEESTTTYGCYKVKRVSDGLYVNATSEGTTFDGTGSDFRLVNRDPNDELKLVTGAQSISFESPTSTSLHYNANAVKYNTGLGAWTTYAMYGPFYQVTMNYVNQANESLKTPQTLYVVEGTTIKAPDNSGNVPSLNKPVMSIGCLSDLHNELGLISSSNLDDVRLRGTILNTVNKMREEEDIDLVILGGDYTSDVTIPEANWERIRDLMHDALRTAFHPEREKKPVIYVTGNHDYEVANFDALPKPYNAARYYDFIMKDDIGELAEKDAFYEDADNGSLGTERLLAAFHYEICGFDFVALNCGKFFFQSAWDYSYSLASVEWVGQKLAELYANSPNRTVFFLLHLPFQDSNSISNINKGMGGRGSAEGVQSAQRLKEILAQYPNVIMLYGHDHGSDNAYIRSKTSQRVTRYDTKGNVIATTDATHVDEDLDGQEQIGGGEEEPTEVSAYLESFSGDGWMNYVGSTENLQCGTTKHPVTFANAKEYTGRFTLKVNNAAYTHLGSTAHFTGNSAISEYSTPYIYHVTSPKSGETVKAQRVTSLLDLKNGEYYAFIGYAKKDKQWYLMTSENTYINYNGLAATLLSASEPGDEIEFEVTTTHAPVWKFVSEDQSSSAQPSFLSAFMGSMRYYNNSIEGDVSVSNSQIVQALMVYIYPDRIVLKMKNYGSSGDFGNIKIEKELAGYTIFRDVENANGPVVGLNNTTGDVIGNHIVRDIYGRTVNNVQKGVFIINDKKVVK